MKVRWQVTAVKADGEKFPIYFTTVKAAEKFMLDNEYKFHRMFIELVLSY